jgi:peptide/nickel transport system substrate-binding protein
MKRFKVIICFVLAVAMLAVSAGCSGNTNPPADTGGASSTVSQGQATAEKTTLRGTATVTPETMDPARGSGENDDLIFVNVYETLVVPNDTDGSAEPWLATEWSASDDGLTWTFKLRDDVVFSDGTKLTADDVKYSMERMLAIGEGYAFLFKDVIESVTAVDATTVEFKLAKVFGPFVNALTVFRIVNKTALEANTVDGMYGENKDYGTTYLTSNAAGSGPYVVSEFKVHESVTLEKNPNYWGKIKDKAPDVVNIIELQDSATSKMLLTNGDGDFIHGHQEGTTVQALIANDGIKVADIPEMGLNYFMMNTKKAPTDDVHIRKAISHLANYQAMSDIYGGMPPADGPVPSTLWGYTNDVTKYEYSVEKAQAEIALSKYADNIKDYPIEVAYIQGNGDTGKLAMLLASDLESAGFTVTINEVPWVLFCDNESTPETSPNITNAFCSSNYPEAGSILEFKYASWTVGNWNQNEWLQDDKLDAMISDALATIDNDQRMEKYAEIQKYLTADVVPSLYPFMSVVKPVYRSDRFTWRLSDGGKPHPASAYNFYYADFEMK